MSATLVFSANEPTELNTMMYSALSTITAQFTLKKNVVLKSLYYRFLVVEAVFGFYYYFFSKQKKKKKISPNTLPNVSRSAEYVRENNDFLALGFFAPEPRAQLRIYYICVIVVWFGYNIFHNIIYVFCVVSLDQVRRVRSSRG